MRHTIDGPELITALLDAGMEPRSYSGRGMYGEKCIGFTSERVLHDTARLVLLLNEACPNREDDIEDLFRSASTDSMGRDTIVYFPGAAWVPEYDQDEEEGE